MRKVIVVAALSAAALSLAALADSDSVKVKRRRLTIPARERLLAPVDGKIVRIVDGQREVPRKTIDEAAQSIKNALSFPVEVVDGTSAPEALADGRAGVAVFLDGRDGAPTLLAAPDSGWAAVGVKALKAGDPTDQVFHARVRKEVWRAFAYAFGVGHESVPSVLRPIYSLGELEAMDAECPSPISLDAITKCAARRGISRFRYVSYHQACREGWAPAPTNDAQRAVWEQVKADKERGPTNPIKIEPPKKGR